MQAPREEPCMQTFLQDLPFANGARVVRLKQPVAAGQIDDAGFSVQE